MANGRYPAAMAAKVMASTAPLREKLVDAENLDNADEGRRELLDWSTRATPIQVAHRIATNERVIRTLEAENAELRGVVKSDTPKLQVRALGVTEVPGILTAAWCLEDRGDRCSLRFIRDDEGHITGVAIDVEDV